MAEFKQLIINKRGCLKSVILNENEEPVMINYLIYR